MEAASAAAVGMMAGGACLAAGCAARTRVPGARGIRVRSSVLRKPFADRGYVLFYARPRKQRSRAATPLHAIVGNLDLAATTLDDESVNRVIRRLEELERKSRAKSIAKLAKKNAKIEAKKSAKLEARKTKRKKRCSSSSSSSLASPMTTDDESETVLKMGALALGCDEMIVDSMATAMASVIPQACGRIEVCAGGKCRKCGSNEVLAALQAGVSSSMVFSSASSSKCMGLCGQGPNVRLHNRGDGVPVTLTGVGVEDVDRLLQLGSGLSGSHSAANACFTDPALGA